MIANLIRSIVPGRFRPIGYLTKLTQEKTSFSVKDGSFAGMSYISSSVGSAYIPKLLGIYERELKTAIDEICSDHPSLIVDIGAAEGYYAIGLALRNLSSQIVAFEMDSEGQLALKEMAAKNCVQERVDIRGKCEPADLEEVLSASPKPVVICDTEGYEEFLLDPGVVNSLHKASVLVELHDFIVPGITETLLQRFQTSHEIEQIWQTSRSRQDFPWRTLGTQIFPNSYLDWAVSEWRPVQMSWLWMIPKQ